MTAIEAGEDRRSELEIELEEEPELLVSRCDAEKREVRRSKGVGVLGDGVAGLMSA
jgi:hypothetical protein